MKKVVCMVGPDKELKGGIATVINEYSKSYLNDKYNLKFISSYSKSKIDFLKGLIEYLILVLRGKIAISHIHVASRGSFLRKSIFILFTPKKIPIILHVHGGGFLDFYNNSNKLLKLSIEKAFNKANFIIVISEKFKLGFIEELKVNENKIIKIYNGINLKNIAVDVASKNNQVIYMGKLTKSKGIYDFLESIPKIHKNCIETSFVIAGDGDVDQVRKIVLDKGLNEWVDVVGWISGKEKERYLLESSILVMPSYFEAFGISIVEAMEYGIAVVATDVGGIPEIVNDNVNGILIKKGDVEALSDSIIFYINNNDIRIETGKNNIYRSKDFDITNTFKKTEELYMKIFNDKAYSKK